MNACKSSSVDCQVMPFAYVGAIVWMIKLRNAQEYSTYSVMLKFVLVPT